MTTVLSTGWLKQKTLFLIILAANPKIKVPGTGFSPDIKSCLVMSDENLVPGSETFLL